MAPSGAGPSANLALARQKIERPALLLDGGAHTRVGLLSVDPKTSSTQAPLAIVCSFERTPPADTLAALHRLAWNFSHAPLLLTVDERELRAFTCSEPPSRDARQQLRPELEGARYIFGEVGSQTRDILGRSSAVPLHWLELATGSFLRKNHRRFKRKNRADNLLLDNLRLLRERLHNDGLDYEIIHDLLARTIFVQFLFDRRDANGFTALSADRLARLFEHEVLSRKYDNFAELLLNHRDTYRLFEHLDQRFNGDLFPSVEYREDRPREKELVESRHLEVLSDFISGTLSLRSRQQSLWPMYSFDTIPLDFISSIYESFVEHDGQAIYTPSHLVDFVLDGILPWNDTNWDLRILDPSCGSGIFLVKALRRLVHRWKLDHGDVQTRIPIQDLRGILENNLFGVDVDPHAVRVAAFSLYLAMCDEIDPKYYWSSVRFPSLQGKQLLAADFFDESKEGGGDIDEGQYDVIVGNAPWGRNTLTRCGERWAREHKWPVSYGDIGPLFLAKSAMLCKPAGVVSMMQPTGTLLSNISAPARGTRERLFGTLGVTEVVNLSALRFGLFRTAVGPSTLVTLTPESKAETITYVCPKPMDEESIDCYRIVADQYDVHEIDRRDAATGTDHWTVLFWGTRRDLALIRRLASWPSLLSYESEGKVSRRQGIIRSRRGRSQPEIVGRFMLDAPDFPENAFLLLAAGQLPRNYDDRTHDRDSTDFSAFEPSQMLVKVSWTVDKPRFRAVLVDSDETGVLCSRDYISVRTDSEAKGLLEAACVMLNSRLTVYFVLGHSGRFATYRPAPEIVEILATPIPDNVAFDQIRSFDDLDARVYSAAGLKESERALVEHAVDFVLPDLKGSDRRRTRAPTERGAVNGLEAYCTWFIRTLTAGLRERSLSATVFEEVHGDPKLPIRLVAISLGGAEDGMKRVLTRRVSAYALRGLIGEVHSSLDDTGSREDVCPNVARVFGFTEVPGSVGRIPTVFIAKSDQLRYWTPAMAMRDADDVSAELLRQGRE